MHLLDFLFPRRCLGCGRIGKYFCDQCRLAVKPIAQSETICPICQKGAISGLTHPRCRRQGRLDGLTSLFDYSGPLKVAIHSLKYRGVTDLAGELRSLIKYALDYQTSHNFISKQGSGGLPSVCVPIPLHKIRLRERGFNQAELLARLIAAESGWPVRMDILVRTRETVPQVEMKKRTFRMTNMRGVFAVKPGVKLPADLGIVLVDDVYTTGATLSAAAKTLKAAGVPWVWAVTLAR